jgi:hypothetical protein
VYVYVYVYVYVMYMYMYMYKVLAEGRRVCLTPTLIP